MSGALQAAFQNQRSFALAIGSAFGGGYYAGQISTAGNGIADYNLVVGPKASAESIKQWKTVNTTTAGTTSVINGPANSAAMNDANHPAAQFCEALTIGGFTDWYMAAENEVDVCYYNLKPTTTNNYTGNGANANSVPTRTSNYTTGVPTQTSAADFQGPSSSEFFGSVSYVSSTEASATDARKQGFFNGQQYSGPKNYAGRVRAIRRVAV